MSANQVVRVLVVDQQIQVIDDYRQIFGIESAFDLEQAGPYRRPDLQKELLCLEGIPKVDLYAATDADSALSGFETACDEKNPFTVVFLDLDLREEGGGLALAQAMRQRDPDVFIVFLTARNNVSAHQLCREVAPADRLALLAKPFTAAEIQLQLLSLHHRRQIERGLRNRDGHASVAGRGFGTAAFSHDFPIGMMIFDRRDRMLCANDGMHKILPELADILEPGCNYADFLNFLAEELLPDGTIYRHDSWLRERMNWHQMSGGVLEQKLRDQRTLQFIEGPAENAGTYVLVADVSELSRRQESQVTSDHMTLVAQSFSALCDQMQALMEKAAGPVVEELPAQGLGEVAYLFGQKNETSHFYQLANRMMAIAQRQKLSPEQLFLNGICAEVIRQARTEMPAGIEISLVAGAGLWPVLIDEKQFRECLVEILRNARDSMEGLGRIIVETENLRIGRDPGMPNQKSQSGDFVRVSISDTGPGIPPDMASRAFNPFFTSKSDKGHLGLGLSAAYGFVTQSGGQIQISERSEGGARVELVLPKTTKAGDLPQGSRRSRSTKVLKKVAG